MTTKAEALREKLWKNHRMGSMGIHQPEAIARTIVEELGITEKIIATVRTYAYIADEIYEGDEINVDKAADALSTLLELAGETP